MFKTQEYGVHCKFKCSSTTNIEHGASFGKYSIEHLSPFMVLIFSHLPLSYFVRVFWLPRLPAFFSFFLPKETFWQRDMNVFINDPCHLFCLYAWLNTGFGSYVPYGILIFIILKVKGRTSHFKLKKLYLINLQVNENMKNSKKLLGILKIIASALSFLLGLEFLKYF